jgi:hypothetical protein
MEPMAGKRWEEVQILEEIRPFVQNPKIKKLIHQKM